MIAPLLFCKYFAVPKDESCSRSIFDGRLFCDVCKAPPPVNIPDIPTIIKTIAELGAGERLFGLTADNRHWFHRIGVKNDLAKYFGIKCNDNIFR